MKHAWMLLGLLLLLVGMRSVQNGPVPDEPDGRGELFGTITDAATGAALAGVTVTVKGVSRAATSKRDGRYVVYDVPIGTYQVEAVRVGYVSQSIRVTIAPQGRTRLDVALQPSTGVPEHEAVLSQDASSAVGVPQTAMKSFAAPLTGRSAGSWRSPLPAGYNTEEYAYIRENAFQDPRDHPLSTFSVDVDAASYSNIRRFIRDGQLPPIDAVRVEEMVNYFAYEYPDPEPGQPFSVTTEEGAAPWNPAHRLVHVGLQGRRLAEADRPASNLVFLLDVSGSMNAPDKLPLLKQAFRLLVNELGPDDRVAIVVYAGASGVVLPSTSGDRKDAILDAINGLEAGGFTAGAAGIRLAYATAGEHFIDGGNNRVILATDGDFNVGVSSESELVRLIEDKREEGTFLTVLGFGTGNIKDARMEQLADHGNGAYYYIDSDLEARKVLVHELGSTLYTIAKDVKIQVEFNPAHVAAYRLIGYENRLLADEDFADDTKDAGEIGEGHTVTALYEIVPVGAKTNAPVRRPGDLKYQDSQVTASAQESDEWMTVKVRYKAPDGDVSRLIERPVVVAEPATTTDAFRFSAAVAAFGMVLRGSEHAGDASPQMVLALAEDALGEDQGGYRAEFLDLVRSYQRLTGETEASTAAR